VSRTVRRGPYGSGLDPAEFRAAFTTGRFPVAVVGLGKMGLPLAAVYADVTGAVVGVDLDERRVDAVNDGETPVSGEPGLPELVERTVADGALTATSDGVEAADAAAIHVLLVPTTTESREGADLSAMRAAAETVGEGLSAGDLVIVESTVPPRTCADVLTPLLARESGLDPESFGVAFCPERTASGRALRDIRGAYPKVVGGTDAAATRAARFVYEEITDNDVLPVEATTAECVKVFEGVYRDVNIALANELATFADELDADVRDAISVANTLPMCDIHDPGVGVGGHCIPYYPYFLLSEFDTEGALMRTARAVNDAMPTRVADRLVERFESRGGIDGQRVVLLGVTYRPGVAETRKSPAIPLGERLVAAGADVSAVDPLLDDDGGLPFPLVSLDSLRDSSPAAVVVVTPHEEFGGIDWDTLDPMVVVDGRDAFDLDGTHHDVLTVGRP
jgi:UDP-N-acetyl-D-mannosaminuronic acid dehydrogenase